MSWQTILAIGGGGFIGAIMRGYINTLVAQKLPNDFPYATLGVNLVGSFLMGLFVAYFMYTNFFSEQAKFFLTTGILGALTTYSAFAIESLVLLQAGHMLLAFLNITLHVFGTICMAGIGFYIVKYLFLK
jgi:CrcB protein